MSLHDQITLAATIRAKLDEMAVNDPDVIRDTLEGQTDIYEIMDWVLGKIVEEDTMATAIADRVLTLQSRQDGCKRRKDGFRELLQVIMHATGERSVRRPEATVTLSQRKQGIASIDESLLPEEFWKTERKVSRSAINDALKEGKAIPGVLMDNGGESLTIRRK